MSLFSTQINTRYSYTGSGLFEIFYCFFLGCAFSGNGGSLNLETDTVIMSNCAFIDSVSSGVNKGGSFFIKSSSFSIKLCCMNSCYSQKYGAAGYIDSTNFELENTIITNCTGNTNTFHALSQNSTIKNVNLSFAK